MRPAGNFSSSFRGAGDAPPPALQPHPSLQTPRTSSPLAQRPGASPTTSQPPRNAALPRRGLSSEDPALGQQRCADLDHPQWYPLPPALRELATARGRTKLAQQIANARLHAELAQDGHFPNLALEGICSGVTNIWIRLHHAQPDAPPAARQAVLMSGPSIAHATLASRLYWADTSWHEAKGIKGMQRLFEASQREAKPEVGLALQPRLDNPNPEHRTGNEIAASILRHQGYAELAIELETKESRQGGGHSIVVFNPGKNQPVTICDGNLGEFVVEPARLQEFLRAWAQAYGTPPPHEEAEGYTVRDIGVYPVRVSGDIAITPLASLGNDLHQAATSRASGPADPGKSSPSRPDAALGAGPGAD